MELITVKDAKGIIREMNRNITGAKFEIRDTSGPNWYGYEYTLFFQSGGEETEVCKTQMVWDDGKFMLRFDSDEIYGAFELCKKETEK